jgi:hypothetical protein
MQPLETAATILVDLEIQLQPVDLGQINADFTAQSGREWLANLE